MGKQIINKSYLLLLFISEMMFRLFLLSILWLHPSKSTSPLPSNMHRKNKHIDYSSSATKLRQSTRKKGDRGFMPLPPSIDTTSITSKNDLDKYMTAAEFKFKMAARSTKGGAADVTAALSSAKGGGAAGGGGTTPPAVAPGAKGGAASASKSGGAASKGGGASKGGASKGGSKGGSSAAAKGGNKAGAASTKTGASGASSAAKAGSSSGAAAFKSDGSSASSGAGGKAGATSGTSGSGSASKGGASASKGGASASKGGASAAGGMGAMGAMAAIGSTTSGGTMGANGKECSGRGKLEEDDNMGDFLEVKEDISSNSRLQGFTSSSSMPSSRSSSSSSSMKGSVGSSRGPQKKCDCDQGWGGESCDQDLLNVLKSCSPLDASCAPPVAVESPPCMGPAEDYALDDPCADPRRKHNPYPPGFPPSKIPEYRPPPPEVLPVEDSEAGGEAGGEAVARR